MILFGVLFAINLAAGLAAMMFFGLGLGDGTVTSANILIWAAILGALFSLPGAAWLMRLRGRPQLGILMLLPVAVAAVLGAVAVLVLMVNPPDWR